MRVSQFLSININSLTSWGRYMEGQGITRVMKMNPELVILLVALERRSVGFISGITNCYWTNCQVHLTVQIIQSDIPWVVLLTNHKYFYYYKKTYGGAAAQMCLITNTFCSALISRLLSSERKKSSRISCGNIWAQRLKSPLSQLLFNLLLSTCMCMCTLWAWCSFSTWRFSASFTQKRGPLESATLRWLGNDAQILTGVSLVGWGASMRFPSYSFSFLCTLQPHLADAHPKHLKNNRIMRKDQTIGLNYSQWHEKLKRRRLRKPIKGNLC